MVQMTDLDSTTAVRKCSSNRRLRYEAFVPEGVKSRLRRRRLDDNSEPLEAMELMQAMALVLI